jgi:hypothetical protein
MAPEGARLLANILMENLNARPATITGITGAVTSIVALVISIKNYVRVSTLKALDLRLELQKSFNNLDIVLSGSMAIRFVHQSHMRVLAATGRNQSGEMKLFRGRIRE